MKCFYGFGNLGDELLFWGVLDFIDTNYPTITQLTVEVGDVQWMQEWRDRNCELIQRL